MRFAPSPTGFLHVGNARTALFNWMFARQKQGDFILRIEDTDIERSSPEYQDKLMADLKWLGLEWDEGPGADGDHGPYLQSLRLDFYKENTKKLLDQEKAYPCFCSVEELERERKTAIEKGRTPIYSRKCLAIPLKEALERIDGGEKAAVRLLTPGKGSLEYTDIVRGKLTFDLSLIGDPIILRSNGLPAYNFAVVVDDHLMEISHVIRGEDHISNTPRQLLAYQALSLSPPQFAHLSMVMGKDNTRLSKRHGATAVDQFKKNGILPSALFNYLALLGWAPPDDKEVLSQEELVGFFTLNKVSRSAAIFDYDKLHWINRQHIKNLSSHQKAEIAYSHLKEKKILPAAMSSNHWEWLEKAVDSFIEKVDQFSELPHYFETLFEFSLADLDPENLVLLKSDCGQKVLASFRDKAGDAGELDFQKFTDIVQEIKEETGCKGKDLYRPLRIALTARDEGLDLDKFIPLVETGAKLDLPRKMKNCLLRAEEAMAFIEET